MIKAERQRDYEVGKGKPPKHRQFQPGQSGNPKGRKKGVMTIADALRGALNQRVTIREGQRTLRVTRREAAIRSAVINAINGDYKAFSAVLELAQKLNIEAPISKEAGGVLLVGEPLSREEWEKEAARQQSPAGAAIPPDAELNLARWLKESGEAELGSPAEQFHDRAGAKKARK